MGNLFIYLGDKYSTTWDLKNETLADVKGNLSFAYYSWDGEPKRVIGYWNDEDQSEIDKYPNSLGQSLLYCIEEYLQSGEV